MAEKKSTIISDCMKLDNTGVRAARPQMGYDFKPLPAKPVSSLDIYREMLDESELSKAKDVTSTQNMRKAAQWINKGYSTDHAVDVVYRDDLDTPDAVDRYKMTIKGKHKKDY